MSHNATLSLIKMINEYWDYIEKKNSGEPGTATWLFEPGLLGSHVVYCRVELVCFPYGKGCHLETQVREADDQFLCSSLPSTPYFPHLCPFIEKERKRH